MIPVSEILKTIAHKRTPNSDADKHTGSAKKTLWSGCLMKAFQLKDGTLKACVGGLNRP